MKLTSSPPNEWWHQQLSVAWSQGDSNNWDPYCSLNLPERAIHMKKWKQVTRIRFGYYGDILKYFILVKFYKKIIFAHISVTELQETPQPLLFFLDPIFHVGFKYSIKFSRKSFGITFPLAKEQLCNVFGLLITLNVFSKTFRRICCVMLTFPARLQIFYCSSPST